MGRSAEDPSTDRPQGRTDASARARARRIGHRAPAAVGVRAALVRAFARTCAYAVRLNNAAEGRAHIVHAPSWWNQGGSPRSKAFTVLSAAPRGIPIGKQDAEAKNLLSRMRAKTCARYASRIRTELGKPQVAQRQWLTG